MKLYRVKKSNIDRKGRGLYATQDIKEGTRIIDYVGKIITKKQTEVSDKFDNAKPIYLFDLNNRYDLDGDVSWNTARLINHSCSNNCDYDGKGLKLWVTAIKDIKNVSVKISMEAVAHLIKNSIDKNKLEKLYIKNLDQTKTSLKHIKS